MPPSTPDVPPFSVVLPPRFDRFRQQTDIPRLALLELLASFNEMRDGYGSLPSADSEAMGEVARQAKFAGPLEWGLRPVDAAHSMASLLLYVAEDHITSLSRLIDAPTVPTFTHTVVVRAALEALARAAWLAQPGIGDRRRVARYMTEVVNSHNEAAKLPGFDGADARRQARDDIFAEAAHQGFKKVKGRSGPGFDEPRISNTAVIRWLIARHTDKNDPAAATGEAMYRTYTAVAHSTHYGIVSRIEAGPVSPISGLSSARLRVSSMEIVRAIASVSLGYCVAVEEMRVLMGWDRTDRYIAAYRGALATVPPDNP